MGVSFNIKVVYSLIFGCVDIVFAPLCRLKRLNSSDCVFASLVGHSLIESQIESVILSLCQYWLSLDKLIIIDCSLFLENRHLLCHTFWLVTPEVLPPLLWFCILASRACCNLPIHLWSILHPSSPPQPLCITFRSQCCVVDKISSGVVAEFD